MALRRAIAKRLIQNQTPAIGDLLSQKALNVTKSYFHRDLLTSPQKPSPAGAAGINQSSAMSLPELFSFPVGERLREKLSISNGERRLRLDGLKSPAVNVDSVGISVNDARKILRVSQLRKVRSALNQITTNSISYSEYVTVCIESSGNHEQGVEFSKMLDQAGDVIVLGNIVFLRPDQLAKSMEKLILQSIAIPNDPRKQELETLETQKALIDRKSLSQVRAELYCGLGFLVIQTLGFMRLTFWELSWDVMEPICFFVTSFHFALAYMFFIKTSKEPTFEGYFQRRFKTKQRKLMEVHGFDIQKYNDLCKAFYVTHRGGESGSLCFQDLSRGASSNSVFS